MDFLQSVKWKLNVSMTLSPKSYKTLSCDGHKELCQLGIFPDLSILEKYFLRV
jgi:hypothetical protein